jgi:hypothetical protein
MAAWTKNIDLKKAGAWQDLKFYFGAVWPYFVLILKRSCWKDQNHDFLSLPTSSTSTNWWIVILFESLRLSHFFKCKKKHYWIFILLNFFIKILFHIINKIKYRNPRTWDFPEFFVKRLLYLQSIFCMPNVRA